MTLKVVSNGARVPEDIVAHSHSCKTWLGMASFMCAVTLSIANGGLSISRTMVAIGNLMRSSLCGPKGLRTMGSKQTNTRDAVPCIYNREYCQFD